MIWSGRKSIFVVYRCNIVALNRTVSPFLKKIKRSKNNELYGDFVLTI
mgnify:CR=1 FL=1